VPLLDRTGWAADPWTRDDGAADAAIVPFDALDAALIGRRDGQQIGVDLPNNVPLTRLEPWLDRLDLIAIAFPAHGDGRGFSLARALRERGYGGRLRAVGQLIPDQFAFALQCGFDEVEIGDDRAARQPLFQWLEALVEIGESYQKGPAQPSILARRRAAA
jgi:uncharacterized protein (DUF934 family)